MNSEEMNQNDNFQIWGGLGTLIWSIPIVGIYLVVNGFTIVVLATLNNAGASPNEILKIASGLEESGYALSLASISASIVTLLLILGIIKLRKKSNISNYLGLKLTDFKTTGIWLIAVVVLISVADVVIYLLGYPVVPDFVFNIYSTRGSIFIFALGIVIAAPIIEEVFFRGFLITGLSATFVGTYGAILISSIIWASMHVQYDFYYLVVIFFLGIFLGVARIKTGSLLLAIMLHSAVNLLSLVEVAYKS